MAFVIRTAVKKSDIHGKGVFSLEHVVKGSVVAVLSDNMLIATEKEIVKMSKHSKIIEQSSARLAGDCFIYRKSIKNEDFFNHSERPAMLYHCGVCFAARDIKPGEELTLDYRYFLNYAESIYDKSSGRHITGYTGKVALSKSSKRLVNLLRSVRRRDHR